MTARELYTHDSGFRGFLAGWDEHRRPALVLVDYLLDRGMAAQAECVRWAATHRERRVHAPHTDRGERDSPCGPFPTIYYGGYAWDFRGLVSEAESTAEDVPPDAVPEHLRADLYPPEHDRTYNPVDAILALMDVWLEDYVVEVCRV